MKRAAFLVAIVFGSLSIFAFPPSARSQAGSSLTQFSATSTMVMNGRTVTSKVARSGNKIRVGMPAGPSGDAYMIFLIDQQKTYMVMGGGMCMEMQQAGALASNPLAASSQGKVDVKVIGAGTMNGHPVKIEDETITSTNGKIMHMKVWAATDLKDFAVRTEMQTPKGVATTNYTDISLATPPDSLFAVPDNCHQMPSMPGAQQP